MENSQYSWVSCGKWDEAPHVPGVCCKGEHPKPNGLATQTPSLQKDASTVVLEGSHSATKSIIMTGATPSLASMLGWIRGEGKTGLSSEHMSDSVKPCNPDLVNQEPHKYTDGKENSSRSAVQRLEAARWHSTRLPDDAPAPTPTTFHFQEAPQSGCGDPGNGHESPPTSRKEKSRGPTPSNSSHVLPGAANTFAPQNFPSAAEPFPAEQRPLPGFVRPETRTPSLRRPSFPLEDVKLHRDAPLVRPSLSGSNGEWTGTDDLDQAAGALKAAADKFSKAVKRYEDRTGETVNFTVSDYDFTDVHVPGPPRPYCEHTACYLRVQHGGKLCFMHRVDANYRPSGLTKGQKKRLARNSFERRSQLNGANGTFSGDDDISPAWVDVVTPQQFEAEERFRGNIAFVVPERETTFSRVMWTFSTAIVTAFCVYFFIQSVSDVCHVFEQHMQLAQDIGVQLSKLRNFTAFINGAQGEWTGSDDLASRGRSKIGRRAKTPVVRVPAKVEKKKATRPKRTKEEKKVVRQDRKKQLQAQATHLRNPESGWKGPVVVGRGSYKVEGGLGSRLGGKLGTWLGGLAEKYVGTLFGSGDYVEAQAPIASNTLIGVTTPSAQQIPSMHSTNESFRAQRREFIGIVSMSNSTDITYGLLTGTLTPCNPHLFPWVSNIAPCFQKWMPLGIVFELRSTSSMVSSNDAGMGTLLMTCNYDVAKTLSRVLSVALNSEFAVSGKPSENILFPIECDPKTLGTCPYFTTPPINTVDKHLYEMGLFGVGSAQAPTAYAGAAQLWVSYDFALLQPCMPPVGSALGGFAHVPLNYTDETKPIARFESSEGFVDTIGIMAMTDTKLIFSPLLAAGSILVIEIFHYSDGAEVDMYAPATYPWEGGIAPYSDFFTTDDAVFDSDIIRSASQAATGAPDAPAIAVCSQTFYYDGTGTDLYPPTVTFSGAQCNNPAGGDLFIYALPPESMEPPAPTVPGIYPANRAVPGHAGRRKAEPGVERKTEWLKPKHPALPSVPEVVTPECKDEAYTGRPRQRKFCCPVAAAKAGVHRDPLRKWACEKCDPGTPASSLSPAPRPVRVRLPVLSPDVDACTTLNGAQGSYTGSDDVEDVKCVPGSPMQITERGLVVSNPLISVNPVGAVVQGQDLRAEWGNLSRMGYKSPGLALIKCKFSRGKVGYFWAGLMLGGKQLAVAKRITAKVEALGGWRFGMIDWLDNMARTGEYEEYQNPDHVIQINGANGSFTGTDDLPALVQECPLRAKCKRQGGHLHRKKGDKPKGPVKPQKGHGKRFIVCGKPVAECGEHLHFVMGIVRNEEYVANADGELELQGAIERFADAPPEVQRQIAQDDDDGQDHKHQDIANMGLGEFKRDREVKEAQVVIAPNARAPANLLGQVVFGNFDGEEKAPVPANMAPAPQVQQPQPPAPPVVLAPQPRRVRINLQPQVIPQPRVDAEAVRAAHAYNEHVVQAISFTVAVMSLSIGTIIALGSIGLMIVGAFGLVWMFRQEAFRFLTWFSQPLCRTVRRCRRPHPPAPPAPLLPPLLPDDPPRPHPPPDPDPDDGEYRCGFLIPRQHLVTVDRITAAAYVNWDRKDYDSVDEQVAVRRASINSAKHQKFAEYMGANFGEFIAALLSEAQDRSMDTRFAYAARMALGDAEYSRCDCFWAGFRGQKIVCHSLGQEVNKAATWATTVRNIEPMYKPTCLQGHTASKRLLAMENLPAHSIPRSRPWYERWWSRGVLAHALLEELFKLLITFAISVFSFQRPARPDTTGMSRPLPDAIMEQMNAYLEYDGRTPLWDYAPNLTALFLHLGLCCAMGLLETNGRTWKSWTLKALLCAMFHFTTAYMHTLGAFVEWDLLQLWLPVGFMVSCYIHFKYNEWAAIRGNQTFNVVRAICVAEWPHNRVPTQPAFISEQNASSRSKDYRCEPTFGARSSWGVQGFYADTFRNCCHNDEISLEGRVGKLLRQHEHAPEVLAHWIRQMPIVDTVIERLLEPCEGERGPIRQPVDFDEWVSTFPGTKKRMFQRLRDESPYCPKFNAKSFIKQELVLRSEGAAERVKDPRMIQGCPPELTLRTGRHVRKLAKRTCKAMDPKFGSPLDGHHIVYTCGMSADKVGEAYQQALDIIAGLCDDGERVVVIEDDQSRFDEHMTQGPFEALERIYGALLRPDVAKRLKRGLSQGTTGMGTKYSIPYTMQSGWPDTSVGDTLINIIMKIGAHGYKRKWISIVCGDDSVTVTTDRELAAVGGVDGLTRHYEACGMDVEIVVRDHPDDVEFCSSRFMKVGSTYALVPKAGKFLARWGWDRIDRSPKKQRMWERGMVATLENMAPLDPICAALALRLRRLVGFGPAIENLDLVNPYSVLYTKTTSHATRVEQLDYYMRHYGVGSADLVNIECEIATMQLGDMLRHPCCRLVASVDATQ